MARVKVCRLCGEHNGPDELFCVATDCGTSLADVSVVDSSWIESQAADNATDERGDIEPRVQGQQNQAPPADGRTVRDIDIDQAAPCALVFPWGRVPVAGTLGVGREAGFSPISEHLNAFSTVSRRHAIVGTAQAQWVVRDLGSTNGTYLNGVRLAGGETRAIGNGDRVSFSKSLEVEVEIAAAGGGSGAIGQ